MNQFDSLLNIQKAFALTRIYLILITIFTLSVGGYAIILHISLPKLKEIRSMYWKMASHFY